MMTFKLKKTRLVEEDDYLTYPKFIMIGEHSDLEEKDLIQLEEDSSEWVIQDVVRNEGYAEELYGIKMSNNGLNDFRVRQIPLGSRYLKIVAS